MNARILGIVVGWALMSSGVAWAQGPRAVTSAAADQELARLQGSWRAFQLQAGGRTIDERLLWKKGMAVSLDLHGDHYQFRGMGAEFKGRVHVDTSTKPMRVVFERNDGTTSTSAYELDGNKLKLVGINDDPQNAKQNADPDVWQFRRDR